MFRKKDNEFIMRGFYCIACKQYMLARTALLVYANFLFRTTIKRMTKQYVSILKINMVEEAILKLRLRKIDKARNYLSD